jgi:hypothetical protein
MFFPLYIGMFPILYFSPSFLTPSTLLSRLLPITDSDYYSKHDKNILITFIFYHGTFVKQDHYMARHVLYVELNKFRFLTHAFQSTPLCSSIDTLATHCTDNLAIKFCVVRPAEMPAERLEKVSLLSVQ